MLARNSQSYSSAARPAPPGTVCGPASKPDFPSLGNTLWQIIRKWRPINALRPLMKRDAAQRLHHLAIQLRSLARPFRGELIYYHLRYPSLERRTRRYYRHCSDQNCLIASMKEKNLIFSVTAGRTGTLFTHASFTSARYDQFA
jgi:hypothetical protein